jgi:hypothetical protein
MGMPKLQRVRGDPGAHPGQRALHDLRCRKHATAWRRRPLTERAGEQEHRTAAAR